LRQQVIRKHAGKSRLPNGGNRFRTFARLEVIPPAC
jgi:hypothetical protein